MLIKKFQEGGVAPEAAAAPAPEQGGAEEQLAALAQQLVEMLLQQVGDPQAVMAVLQMAAEMLQGAAGAPAGAAPEGEPVFKAGGKISRRCKCGCKAEKGAKLVAKCGAKAPKKARK